MDSFLSDRPAEIGIRPTARPGRRGESRGLPLRGQACQPRHEHLAGEAEDGDDSPLKVEYVSEYDQVTRIIVTCSCGASVELECQW